jgi:hypothetical protein
VIFFMQVFVPSCKLTLDGLMKTYWPFVNLLRSVDRNAW